MVTSNPDLSHSVQGSVDTELPGAQPGSAGADDPVGKPSKGQPSCFWKVTYGSPPRGWVCTYTQEEMGVDGKGAPGGSIGQNKSQV